jgi:regulation of enolase protein 1 (concanavalin A-like superfamily)
MLLSLVVAAMIAAAPPTTAPVATESSKDALFEENFDDKLADGWTWVREDRDAWRIENGALHLKVFPGSLFGGGNDAKNVLIRPLPAQDDISIEVTITNDPKEQAEQATLLWYADDDNYVKLCKEQMSGKQNVVLAREEAGKGAFVASVPSAAPTLRLRLTRHADKIAADFATGQDEAWNHVGSCPPPAGADLKLGLIAHGAKAGSQGEAEFDRLRVSMAAK